MRSYKVLQHANAALYNVVRAEQQLAWRRGKAGFNLVATFLRNYLDAETRLDEVTLTEDAMEYITDSSLGEAYISMFCRDIRLTTRTSAVGSKTRVVRVDKDWRSHKFDGTEEPALFAAFHKVQYKVHFNGVATRAINKCTCFEGIFRIDLLDYWGFAEEKNDVRNPFQAGRFADIPKPKSFRDFREGHLRILQERGLVDDFFVKGTLTRRLKVLCCPGEIRGSVSGI